MDGLKPCPFCGGEGMLFSAQFGAEKTPRYNTCCRDCSCDLKWEFFSKEEAIAAWNRRVEK